MQEYAKFVAMIRENRKTMKPEKAVIKAVDDCIEQGILRDFLMKNKARAIKTSIYEYDAKRQRKFDKEEGKYETIMMLCCAGDITSTRAAEILDLTPEEFQKEHEKWLAEREKKLKAGHGSLQ